jgi:hypothetical protein
MALKPGDRWVGLDTLRVVDEVTGELLTDGFIVVDMDIDPDENRITLTVSSDIG